MFLFFFLSVLISLSSSVSPSNCALCSRLVNKCNATSGGVFYASVNCFHNQNNVYFTTVDINTACTPPDLNVAAGYYGYSVGSNSYSNCYATATTNASCPTDCYPSHSCASTQKSSNCAMGRYAISAYGSTNTLLFRLYCYLIAKDNYSLNRGDLFHNCANSTFGGPYTLPGSGPIPPFQPPISGSDGYNPNEESSTNLPTFTEESTEETIWITNSPTESTTTNLPTEAPSNSPTTSPTTTTTEETFMPLTQYSFSQEHNYLIGTTQSGGCGCQVSTKYKGMVNCQASGVNQNCVNQVTRQGSVYVGCGSAGGTASIKRNGKRQLVGLC